MEQECNRNESMGIKGPIGRTYCKDIISTLGITWNHIGDALGSISEENIPILNCFGSVGRIFSWCISFCHSVTAPIHL